MNKNNLIITGLFVTGLTLIMVSFIIVNNREKVTSPPLPNGCDSDCQAWLDAHNKYRDTPLTWDTNLASQAKEYSGKLNSIGSIHHGDLCNPNCTGSSCSGGHTCGQNLEQSPEPVDAGSAVDRWYNECSMYKSPPTTPGEFNKQGEVFHYTQVVWKGTKKVGCGMVGNVSSCLYDRGNLLGDFHENVPPPGTCKGIQHSFQSGLGIFD